MRSARFAGEDATDEENLAKLLREAPAGSPLAYVCALVLAEPGGRRAGRAARRRGPLHRHARRRRRAATAASATTPPSSPTTSPDGRTMAELEPHEKDAISHRGRAARELLALLDGLMAGPLHRARARTARGTVKTRAAALSIVSNTILIALKLAAGAITGSVAIITEAMHSSVDLIASVVAYVSVRTADKPADADHPYGHDKFENLAAAIEALLILVGAGRHRLRVRAPAVDAAPRCTRSASASRVIAFSVLANVVVSTVLARRARETDSPALEGDAAHLRTDAATSAAVLVGLVARRRSPARRGWTR